MRKFFGCVRNPIVRCPGPFPTPHAPGVSPVTSIPLYFISDLHLGTDTPEVERRKQDLLLRLFGEVMEQEARLYIVGDLFDFWFEYRHVVPSGHHRVLAGLEQLARKGVSITYLAGNHDFAIGRFFSRDLGVTVIHDSLEFVHEGTRFHLYHGDGLAVNDGGYRFIKRILRNRVAQWAFRWIHPDVGFALAHAVSHTSRGYTAGRWYGVEDGLKLAAGRIIEAGSDIVIMGHRHLPCIETIGNGVYVNLGDWLGHYTFAVHRDSSIHLYELTEHESRKLH